MLPNPERAFVAPNKVRDYLLSPSHPVGRFKARYSWLLVTRKKIGRGFAMIFWP